MDPSAFIQEYFQIRSGDTVGLNTDSGWAAAENTDATIGAGVLFRVRFKVRETAGGTDSPAFKLQVNRNSGGWVDVDILGTGAAPASIAMVSAQFDNGDAATELLTNTSTYVNGEGLETNISSGYSLTNEEAEFEWCLMILGFHDGPTQNVAGDTLDFRVVLSDGTAFGGAYTSPTITVSETAGYIGGTYVEHPATIGPFIDGNGNIYTVIEPSVNDNVLALIKSTDGGDTWREMDGANRPTQTDIEGLDIFQDGDTLHILHVKSATYYHRFRMSDHSTDPDTWEITDEVVDDTVSAHSRQVGSLVKRSDGTIAAFYIDGVSPSRIRYKIRNGSWGSQNTVDTEAATDFVSPFCVLGASDKTHLIYKDDTNGIIYHRSLNSSDSLSDRESIATGLPTGLGGDDIPYVPPVYYDSSGDEKVLIIYKKVYTANPVYSRVITNDGSPGTETLVTDNNVEESEGGNAMVIATAAVDDTTVHFLYSEKNVYDIWSGSNTDEGGWGTDVEEQDGVTCHWIRARVITHSPGNGGSTVVGYVWDNGSDGGTGLVYYDEIVLSTPASDSQVAYLAGASAGTPASDNQTAYLSGVDTASDRQPTYLSSQNVAADNQTAYLAGANTALDNQPGYLAGVDTAADSQPAYLAGSNTTSDSQAAYLQGQVFALGSSTAYLAGQNIATGSASAYMSGSTAVAVSDNKAGYLAGQNTSNDNKAAYIGGESISSVSQSAYLAGEASVLDNASVYLSGQNPAIDSASVYMSGIAASAVGNKTAYMSGENTSSSSQPAYAAGEAIAQDNTPAYLKGQGSTSNSQPLYLKGQNSSSNAMSTYMVAEDATSSSASAYMSGGVIETSFAPCYMVGELQGTASKPVFLGGGIAAIGSKAIYLSGSGIAAASSQPIYIPVGGAVQDQSQVYMSGSDASESAAPGYLSGQAGVLSDTIAYLMGESPTLDNVNLYLAGIDTLSDSKNSYLAGVSTALDNRASFLAGWGQTSSGTPLYLNGAMQTQGQQVLYLRGSLSATEVQALYLRGMLSLSASKSAFITAMPEPASSVSAYMSGYSADIIGEITVFSPPSEINISSPPNEIKVFS